MNKNLICFMVFLQIISAVFALSPTHPANSITNGTFTGQIRFANLTATCNASSSKFTSCNDFLTITKYGFIGIGTNTPNTKLHVAGNLTVSDTITASRLLFPDGTSITSTQSFMPIQYQGAIQYVAGVPSSALISEVIEPSCYLGCTINLVYANPWTGGISVSPTKRFFTPQYHGNRGSTADPWYIFNLTGELDRIGHQSDGISESILETPNGVCRWIDSEFNGVTFADISSFSSVISTTTIPINNGYYSSCILVILPY